LIGVYRRVPRLQSNRKSRGEFKLRPTLLGIAETCGDNRGMSYGQVGVC
jgi:hypothetical protein